MKPLLSFSRSIDAINERLGRLANWLVLLACLISAGNAMMRYGLNMGSNAWLEIQWYLFAGMVMLGASYTLQKNEHVRVDILYGRVSTRAQIWIDILGGLLFLLPATIMMGWLAWPMFIHSWQLNETSANAGGLLRWPVKLLVPAGFLLISLQGVSEIIKRIGALTGDCAPPPHYEKPLQ
jgi:TRAP-type mannitol/chloroaromatic compound transport system permease small subunit